MGLATKMPQTKVQKLVCEDINDMLRQLPKYSPDQLFVKIGECNRDLNSHFLNQVIDKYGNIFLTSSGVEGTTTSTYYGGLDPYEMMLLSRLHAIAPENVTRPVAEVFMREPNANGVRKMAYVIELVEGVGLYDYKIKLEMTTNPGKVKHYVKLASKAIDTLRVFHASGVAHGDAHYENILVSGSEPIFIDPMHKSNLRRAMDSDLQNIDVYEMDILNAMELCLRE